MSVFRGAAGGGGGGNTVLYDADGNPIDLSSSLVKRFPGLTSACAAGLNPTSVKPASGALDAFAARNIAAYAIYVSFYDDNAADTDPADDNLVHVLEFPASMTSVGSFDFPAGILFTTGIGFKITKADGSGVLAGDLTNVAAFYR